jgi:hypothetical protein
MTDIINSSGKDAIKGGKFFGSSLTPNGTFENIPKVVKISDERKEDSKPNIILTLEKLKENLNQHTGLSPERDDSNTFADSSVNKFLRKYTQLLIDHEDIRNTIFFGSSYNEMSYQIKYLSESYPFKAYIASIINFNIDDNFDNNTKELTLTTKGGNSIIYFDTDEDVVFNNPLNFVNDGGREWTTNYDIVNSKKERFPIISFGAPNSCRINNVQTYHNENDPASAYYILNISTNYNIKENDLIYFYEKGDVSNKLGVGEIKNIDTSYPIYGNESISIRIKFENISSFANLDILKSKTEGVFESSSVKFLATKIYESGGFWYIDLEDGTTNLQDYFHSFPNTFPNNAYVKLNKEYQITDVTREKRSYVKTVVYAKILNISHTVSGKVTVKLQTPSGNEFIKDDSFINYSNGDLIDIDNSENGGYPFEINIDEQPFVDGVDEEEEKQLLNLEGYFVTLPSNIIRIETRGRVSSADLISHNGGYTLINNLGQNMQEERSGFIISPSLKEIVNFEANLTGLQKALLNILNPTPWPREVITKNIITEGADFQLWVQNPSNMIKNGFEFDESFYTDGPLSKNLDLIGHITLDESETNQLLRRAIPSEWIDELEDGIDNTLFVRYIMLAGKLFDSIKNYIDFIKYTHTLNYTEYNQLSPKFYKEYADHYGLSLFKDEDEDLFSSLIFDTLNEKSTLYIEQEGIVNGIKLKEIVQKRQKHLLVNLLYIYSKKGTVACLETLFNLLGTPDGLAVINEQEYLWDSEEKYGYKRNNNEKVNVPDVKYVIDESKLINPGNISDGVNKPYHYKPIYSQENVYNLREAAINLDPLESISKDIYKYMQTKKPYAYFKKGSFVNLQPIDRNSTEPRYYGLPLTLFGKFSGIGVNYRIDKSSPNNLSTSKFLLCGLFRLGTSATWVDYNYLTSGSIVNIEEVDNEIVITHNSLENLNEGTTITLKGLEGSDPDLNGSWVIKTVVSDTQFAIMNINNEVPIITETFTPNDSKTLNAYKNIVPLEEYQSYQIPLLKDYSLEEIYEQIDINSSFNPNRFPGEGPFLPAKEYVIASLEGRDLVIRLKAGPYFEHNRVAICENVFKNDDLIHNFKLTYRLKGVEVFVDYKFFSFVPWRELKFPPELNNNLNVENYGSSIYPKNEILNCDPLPLLESDISNTSDLEWWDMFTGMPVNIDMYINKVAVYEKTYITQPDVEAIGKTNQLNHDVEKWYFDFENQEKDDEGNYKTDIVNVTSRYNRASPSIWTVDESLPDDEKEVLYEKFSAINNFFIQNFEDVKLSTVDRSSSYIGDSSFNSFLNPIFLEKTLNSIQAFGESEYMKSIIKETGWSPTIHKDYNYFGYKEVLDNYYTFSSKVLEYAELLTYSKTTRKKFLGVVKQFIPIVINISSFNLLYKFFISKYRYERTNYYANCGTYLEANPEASFKVLNVNPPSAVPEFERTPYNEIKLSVWLNGTMKIKRVTDSYQLVVSGDRTSFYPAGKPLSISGIKGIKNINIKTKVENSSFENGETIITLDSNDVSEMSGVYFSEGWVVSRVYFNGRERALASQTLSPTIGRYYVVQYLTTLINGSAESFFKVTNDINTIKVSIEGEDNNGQNRLETFNNFMLANGLETESNTYFLDFSLEQYGEELPWDDVVGKVKSFSMSKKPISCSDDIIVSYNKVELNEINGKYIYYGTENGIDIYIYNKEEISNGVQPPFYIN